MPGQRTLRYSEGSGLPLNRNNAIGSTEALEGKRRHWRQMCLLRRVRPPRSRIHRRKPRQPHRAPPLLFVKYGEIFVGHPWKIVSSRPWSAFQLQWVLTTTRASMLGVDVVLFADPAGSCSTKLANPV